MSTQVAPTNGTAKKQSETVKADNKTPQANGTKPAETKVVTTVSAAVIPIEKSTPDLPPLEDRFYKLDTLFALREKHEALKESLDKINRFKLSSDGRSENIHLKDSNGNSFSTYNPDVLAKVIEWLKEDLTRKIKDVDNQIRF